MVDQNVLLIIRAASVVDQIRWVGGGGGGGGGGDGTELRRGELHAQYAYVVKKVFVWVNAHT